MLRIAWTLLLGCAACPTSGTIQPGSGSSGSSAAASSNGSQSGTSTLSHGSTNSGSQSHGSTSSKLFLRLDFELGLQLRFQLHIQLRKHPQHFRRLEWFLQFLRVGWCEHHRRSRHDRRPQPPVPTRRASPAAVSPYVYGFNSFGMLTPEAQHQMGHPAPRRRRHHRLELDQRLQQLPRPTTATTSRATGPSLATILGQSATGDGIPAAQAAGIAYIATVPNVDYVSGPVVEQPVGRWRRCGRGQSHPAPAAHGYMRRTPPTSPWPATRPPAPPTPTS